MLKSVIASISVAASLFFAGSAGATIINLDMRDSNNGETILLDAGDYRIDPIEDQYQSWNAWGRTRGCDNAGENCSQGWLHLYNVMSAELGNITVGDINARFETSIQALNNALPFFFSLSSQQEVTIFRRDQNYNDNRGGMSLELVDVPEPATVGLLGLGLMGVAASRRRRA